MNPLALQLYDSTVLQLYSSRITHVSTVDNKLYASTALWLYDHTYLDEKLYVPQLFGSSTLQL